MNKKELQKAVFESYALVLRSAALDAEDVNLSTFCCLNKYDMDYFVELLEEKIPEDFSFLKNGRFEILQDVCSEIEYYYPVVDEEEPRVVLKAQNTLKSGSDKQHN